MQTIDVQGTDLGYLLSRVDGGETIVLERNGTPVACLMPVAPVPDISSVSGGFGFLKGKMSLPDDIKTPYAEQIEEMFYGNPEKFKSDWISPNDELNAPAR